MKQNGDLVEFLKQKDYKMIDNNLGSGSFGKAVLLQDPFIDELFVAKKYEPEYPELKEPFYKSFLQEIKIMYKLNHPNIVRIYNYYAYETIHTGFILMEYINGQNIDEYLAQREPWDKAADADNIFIQLIDGFQYLESNKIIHRDIREGNIMIDTNGTVKIIDFGLGKVFSPEKIPEDSLVKEINRSGLEKPNEFFEGIYDSQTDMYYLAELVNRLLVKNQIDDLFSYSNIIRKMMSANKKDRFDNFTDIQEAIHKKDFSEFEINETDKIIYQRFSNSILNNLSCYLHEKKFIYNVEEFSQSIFDALQKNCLEDNIQNNSDIISAIVSSGYRYNSYTITVNSVKNFYDWFDKLTTSSKRLVLSNLIAKLSSVEEEIDDEKLPF